MARSNCILPMEQVYVTDQKGKGDCTGREMSSMS
jgi:hypothetical protein